LTFLQHASFGIKCNDLLEQTGELQLQDAGTAADIEQATGAVQ
jgi:hypothetical protein